MYVKCRGMTYCDTVGVMSLKRMVVFFNASKLRMS